MLLRWLFLLRRILVGVPAMNANDIKDGWELTQEDRSRIAGAAEPVAWLFYDYQGRLAITPFATKPPEAFQVYTHPAEDMRSAPVDEVQAFEAWLDATPSLKPYGNLLLSAWQARATLAAPSRSKRLAKAGFTRRPTGKTVGGLMRETAADKPDDGDD
jgi:hypothetical protein